MAPTLSRILAPTHDPPARWDSGGLLPLTWWLCPARLFLSTAHHWRSWWQHRKPGTSASCPTLPVTCWATPLALSTADHTDLPTLPSIRLRTCGWWTCGIRGAVTRFLRNPIIETESAAHTAEVRRPMIPQSVSRREVGNRSCGDSCRWNRANPTSTLPRSLRGSGQSVCSRLAADLGSHSGPTGGSPGRAGLASLNDME